MINADALADLELERACLGALFLNAALFTELGLNAGDFWLVRHRWIWQAMSTLLEQGQPLDILTVSTHLEQKEKLGEAGGVGYLWELVNETISSYHAPAYAQTLRDLSNRRRLLQITRDLSKAAFELEQPLPTVLPGLSDELAKVTTPTRGGAVHISEWAEATYRAILDRQGQPENTHLLTSKFEDFNRVIGGLDPTEGTMLLLGGKPGAGKTILFTNLALQYQKQAPGVIYSLEMKSRRMMYRVFSMETGLSSWNMRGNKMSPADLDTLSLTVQKLKQTQLYVSDHASLTTQTLAADLFRLKHQYGIKWFGVDYLGLLSDEVGKVEGWEREAVLARRLLRLNRQLGLASLIIHTLNKEGKFSGAAGVQYDTDIAVILEDSPDNFGKSFMEIKTLKFIKNRDGEMPLGQIDLLKHPQIPKFETPVTRKVDLNGYQNGNGYHQEKVRT